MKTKFIRDRNRIIKIEDGSVQKFKSVNAAKKKSREIQMAEDGAFGLGSVMLK